MRRRRAVKTAKRGMALVVGCLCGSVLFAQDLSRPPDFSDRAISDVADSVAQVWSEWDRTTKDLEQSLVRTPDDGNADRLKRANIMLTSYLQARQTYSERVAAYIRSYARDKGNPRSPVVQDQVSSDHLNVLGMSLSRLQGKLDSLRDTANWTTVRRSVQEDRTKITKLQESYRDEIQVERRSQSFASLNLVAADRYLESEDEVRGAIRDLWSHYYGAIESAETVRSIAEKKTVAPAEKKKKKKKVAKAQGSTEK